MKYVDLRISHLAPRNVSEFWFTSLIGHVMSSLTGEGVNQIKKILQWVNQIKKEITEG
jgi:hypothetical protein